MLASSYYIYLEANKVYSYEQHSVLVKFRPKHKTFLCNIILLLYSIGICRRSSDKKGNSEINSLCFNCYKQTKTLSILFLLSWRLFYFSFIPTKSAFRENIVSKNKAVLRTEQKAFS